MSNMLKKFTVHGFKSIERQVIDLGALNVLIGANGSGKSNLLAAFSFLKASALGGLGLRVINDGGANRLLHHGSKVTKACFFALESDGFRYEQTLIPVTADSLAIAKEGVSILGSSMELSEGSGSLEHLEDTLKDEEKAWLQEQVKLGDMTEEDADERLSEFPSPTMQIEGWRRYHLHDVSATAPVKATCEVADNRYLREDMSNLAAFLYWLKKGQTDEYRRVVETIRLAAPYFDDFVLEPSRLNKKRIRLEWKQRGTDAYFDADSFSDGTLRFVCLTTLLSQPRFGMPTLMLIDEPELGLHPLAIRLLAEMLDAASKHTQILVATQSVTLLDQFPIEEIIVAENVGNASQFRRLKPEDYAAWLENFSVGELWEKNVIGGRP